MDDQPPSSHSKTGLLPTLRQITGRLLLGLAGIIAALLILELGVRLIWPHPRPPRNGWYQAESGDLAFRRMVEDLERAKATAEANGTELALVLIPETHAMQNVCQDPDKSVREFWGIIAWAEEEGVPYLDVTPHFCQQPDPPGLYFPIDTHLTVEGYRLLGELAADFLKDEVLP